MKKAIIAGAASAVLAAMPVVGVFAVTDDPVTTGENSYTDTLILNIATACTFGRGETTNGHANGAGNWGTGEGTGSDTAGNANHVDTLSATVLNDKIYDGESGNESALGTSSFVVTCNNKAGYKVSVNASAFAATTAANAQGEYAWGYTAGGSVVTSGNSMYTIATSKTGDEQNIASNIVATKGAPVDDDTFTVTYKAFVDATQPADTYTATAEYTFAQL